MSWIIIRKLLWQCYISKCFPTVVCIMPTRRKYFWDNSDRRTDISDRMTDNSDRRTCKRPHKITRTGDCELCCAMINVCYRRSAQLCVCRIFGECFFYTYSIISWIIIRNLLWQCYISKCCPTVVCIMPTRRKCCWCNIK